MRNNKKEILGKFITTKKGFAFKTKWYMSSGHPIVKVTNMNENSINTDKLTYIPNKIANDYKSFSLKANDIVIQTVGSWPTNPKSVVGKVVRIPRNIEGALLNQNAVIIYPNEKLDKMYLYYILKDYNFKNYIIGTAQGAANQASITLESIKKFKFELIPINIQKKISNLLFNLDSLIENNISSVKILEEICKKLYNHWFVNFSFPSSKKNKFIDFGKKRIPPNWGVSSIEEVSEMISKGPSIVYGENSQVPVLNQKCIRDGKIILNDIRFANELKSKNNNLYLKKKDILINSMGVGTLGRVSRNLSISKKMIIHSCITVIRANSKKIRSEYLYYVVKEFEEYFVKSSKGTTGQTSLDLELVKKLPILVPERNIYKKFLQIITPIWEQIGILENKCEILKKQRDFLLPYLISGKINISNLNLKIPAKVA